MKVVTRRATATTGRVIGLPRDGSRSIRLCGRRKGRSVLLFVREQQGGLRGAEVTTLVHLQKERAGCVRTVRIIEIVSSIPLIVRVHPGLRLDCLETKSPDEDACARALIERIIPVFPRE